ncbi:hypothetical protein NA57DRAFT_65081 [Rhizodiscina lignyota]|uniref:GRIP domain-containing protein n=1 Tax=Rhizodiscina lignyota TaxID=1504668 RepID=A0A9P4MAR8_9PEZI|nr:hypothetical protein NA57DRAFT_65081 [Rhizodiscina lignyota]
MSAQSQSPVIPRSASKSKKKSKRKKGGGAKTEAIDESPAVNGAVDTGDAGIEEDEEDIEEDASPTPPRPSSNGTNHLPDTSEENHEIPIREKADSASGLTEERLEALARERDELRAEVTQLRQSLESITGKHEEEVNGLQDQLEETRSGKEHAEIQYQNLLGKVNQIRSQLGERLKADAEELSQARTQIEDLEDQNRQLQNARAESEANVKRLQSEQERHTQEIAELRGRTNLSQQNWVKERDELIGREAFAREEFETAKQAMQDWEVLAMEERAQRENLSDRIAELEEQLLGQKEAFERAASERDSQSQTVDSLQRALRDIQDARKKELRELVENSQTQLEELRKQLQAAEESSKAAQTELEKTRKDLEHALPFEEQVREKNLLIGKLRHEAVILNDHLTKALRFLRQRKPEDMVDRQIVTNHFIHFLALDRSDPKKFQVLQLIAALLSWTDEQKEQAGLARPGSVGAITGSLRLPQSPFRRTPSTPSLGSDLMLDPQSATSKESLAELWSEFLEREAQEGKSGSRKSSVTSPPSVVGDKEKGPSGLGLQQ